MQRCLRTLALNKAKYDRVTTICLTLGVGAALVYEHDSDLAWLAYIVAAAATVTAATLYFFRRTARRSAKTTEPLVPQWRIHEWVAPSGQFVLAGTVLPIHPYGPNEAAGSFQRFEASMQESGHLNPSLYWPAEVKRTAKNVGLTKTYHRQSEIAPVFEPDIADSDLEYVLACLSVVFEQNQMHWHSSPPLTTKSKRSVSKLHASTIFWS